MYCFPFGILLGFGTSISVATFWKVKPITGRGYNGALHFQGLFPQPGNLTGLAKLSGVFAHTVPVELLLSQSLVLFIPVWLPQWPLEKLMKSRWCMTGTTSYWCVIQNPCSSCWKYFWYRSFPCSMNCDQTWSVKELSFLACSLVSSKLVSFPWSCWNAVAVTGGDSAVWGSATNLGGVS